MSGKPEQSKRVSHCVPMSILGLGPVISLNICMTPLRVYAEWDYNANIDGILTFTKRLRATGNGFV